MEPSLPKLHPEQMKLLKEAKEDVINCVNQLINERFEKLFSTLSESSGGDDSSDGDLPEQVSEQGGSGGGKFEVEAPLDLTTNSHNLKGATIADDNVRSQQQLFNDDDQTAVPNDPQSVQSQQESSRFIDNNNSPTTETTTSSIPQTLPAPNGSAEKVSVKEEIDGQLVRRIEIGDELFDDLLDVNKEPCQCGECSDREICMRQSDVVNENFQEPEIHESGSGDLTESQLMLPQNTDDVPTAPPSVEQTSPVAVSITRNESKLIEKDSSSGYSSATSDASATIPSTSSSKQIKRKVSNDQSRTAVSKPDRSSKKQRSTEVPAGESSASQKSKETRSTQPRKVSSKSNSDRSSSSSSQLSARADKRPEKRMRSSSREKDGDRRAHSSSQRKANVEQVDSACNGDATKKATEWKDSSSSSRKEPRSVSGGGGSSASPDRDRGSGGRIRRRSSSAERRWNRSCSPPRPMASRHHQPEKFTVIYSICKECSSTFFHMDDLKKHELEKHQLKPIRCVHSDCEQTFDSIPQLLLHLRKNHNNVIEWKCKYCRDVYFSERKLAHHIFLAHQKGSFGCTFSGCDHRSSSRSDALKHYDEHFARGEGFRRRNTDEPGNGNTSDRNDDSKYRTEMVKCLHSGCNFFLPSSDQMKEHLKTDHSRNSIGCISAGCSYSFDGDSDLAKHLKDMHSQVKNWVCPIKGCDFGPADQEQMCLHQVRSHQEGRFRCAEPSCHFEDKYRDTVIRHFDRTHRRTASTTSF